MITLRAEGLGKAYRVYRRPFDSLKEFFLKKDYSETFWALRDVTVAVEQERSLGIIGDNGAGKSTLLKLMAGAIAPTTGKIERRGRVAAILTLGAGFHPDLSGVENSRIGCAMLGLSPAETDGLLPVIAEFSELGPFLERPVRTYSSGMYLRLGFSVATAIDPEILIIDEHLSVGDQHFRLKCKRRIMQLRDAGCTIVFCSHDLHGVAELCDQTLWLREGRPAMLGDTKRVVEAYQSHTRVRDDDTEATTVRDRPVPTENCLHDIVIGGDCRDGHIEFGGRLELKVKVRLTEQARRDGVLIAVLIVRSDGLRCYGVTTRSDELAETVYPLGGNEYGINFVIDRLPLLTGLYSFTVALQDMRGPHTYDFRTGVSSFSVQHDSKGEGGVVRIPHHWERP